MLIYLIPLIAPAALLIAAAVAFARPGRRPAAVPELAEACSLAAIAVAVLSAVLLIVQGPGTGLVIGIGEIGLAARLDAVSAVMLLLVSFVGWVVLRYAATYMDGEAKQGAFTGWLSATLAAVLLLVLAGKEYGSGSSRDWAAKGPQLLGVRAVIAESFERIHRSNLVGMGILPLQFLPEDNAETLGLTGHETFDIVFGRFRE